MCLGLDRKDEDYSVEKEPSFTERDNWRLEHYSNIMKYLNYFFFDFYNFFFKKNEREKKKRKRKHEERKENS